MVFTTDRAEGRGLERVSTVTTRRGHDPFSILRLHSGLSDRRALRHSNTGLRRRNVALGDTSEREVRHMAKMKSRISGMWQLPLSGPVDTQSSKPTFECEGDKQPWSHHPCLPPFAILCTSIARKGPASPVLSALRCRICSFPSPGSPHEPDCWRDPEVARS